MTETEKTLDMGMFNSDKPVSKKSSEVPGVDLENNVEKRKKALLDFDDYCKNLREAYDRKHNEFLWYVSTINHIRYQLQLLTETHHNFKLPNRQKLFDLLDDLLKEGTKLPADKRKKLEELKEKQRQMIIETKRDLKESTKKLQELNPLAAELDKELVKHIPDYRGSIAVGGASENNNSFEMINSDEAKRGSAPVKTQGKIIKEEKKVKSLPADFGKVATPVLKKPSGGVVPVAPSPKKPSGGVVPVSPAVKKTFQKTKSLPEVSPAVERTLQKTKYTPEAGVEPGISYRPVLSPRKFKMAPIPHPMRKKIRAHKARMDNLAGKLDDYIVLCNDYEKFYEKKHGEIKELFQMLKKINGMIQTLNSNIYADVKGDISKYSELLKIVTDLDNTETIRTGLKKQIVEQNDYLKEAKKVTKELLTEAEKFRKDPSSYTPPEHHSSQLFPTEGSEKRINQPRQGMNYTEFFDEAGNPHYLDYSQGNTPEAAFTQMQHQRLPVDMGYIEPNYLGLVPPPGATYLEVENPSGEGEYINPDYLVPVSPPQPGATYLEVENPSGQPAGATYLEVENPSGQPAKADYLQIVNKGPKAPGQTVINEPIYAVAQDTPKYNSAPQEAVKAKTPSYEELPIKSGQYNTAQSGVTTYEPIPGGLGGNTNSNPTAAPALPPRNKKLTKTQKRNRNRRNKKRKKKEAEARRQAKLGTNAGLAEALKETKGEIILNPLYKGGAKVGGGRKIGTLKSCCFKNRTKKNSYIGKIMDSNGKRIKLRTKSKRIKELKKLKNKQVTYTEQNGYAVDVREKEQYNNAFPALNMKTKSKTKRKGPSGTEKINTKKKRMRPVGGLPAARR